MNRPRRRLRQALPQQTYDANTPFGKTFNCK